jgi:hypothetical protein
MRITAVGAATILAVALVALWLIRKLPTNQPENAA